jgi:hypothetical protein
MANFLPNLETFLKEVNRYLSMSITDRKKGKIILVLAHDIVTNRKKLQSFIDFMEPLKNRLHLDYYIEHRVSKFSDISSPGMQVVSGDNNCMQLHIDLTALHSDRLKDFFHQETSQKDVADSLSVLLKQGWTEKQFLDIGISHVTYFRYLALLKTMENTQPIT